ncbi:MAG: tetratricopeptide repeat protein, partial [Spirochaetaceae bacterium]|nr:tetratricopeptide repeat protein [Spirochaetaceae bacterium]
MKRIPAYALGGTVIGAALALALGGCSSAPKRPAEIFASRNAAERQLDLANKEADRSRYDSALEILKEVRRLAVSVDDPRLLIREAVTRGTVLYALGSTGEAAEVWAQALDEANTAKEEELAGTVRLYMAKSRLLASPEAAGAVLEEARQEIARMRAEKLSIAFGWTVVGLALKERGEWAEGEDAIKRALEIHEKNNYLEQAAYDWYLIASIRSVAGGYEGAVEALRNAIAFDRRSENTYGLAADWRALGDVYKKAGSLPESRAAYRRSLDIFRSLDFEAEADAVATKLS